MPLRTNLWSRIEPLLPYVERPSRYIGSEFVGRADGCKEGSGHAPCSGSPELGGFRVASPGYTRNPPRAESARGTCPDPSDVLNFCMVYPDTYELGQPNQAVRILVNCVNRTDGLHGERAYLPAADMIDLMREKGIPMFSLESMAPLREFDVIGITLPHELAATNVLNALDLSGIPLHAEDRTEDDPIVIGGGPCAYNPEPYAPFFDAFTIGEGEEATPETLLRIRGLKAQGASRAEMLEELARIPGTYVPSLYKVLGPEEAQAKGSWVQPLKEGVPRTVTKRIYEGFAESDAFEDMVVPYMEVVHDRLNVEILRGCARGCRFCQAGMMYRPVRERPADSIVDAVRRGVEATGYEEVSLTSLSSTDHSQIAEILTRLNDEYGDSAIRVSIPSQRLDSFGVEMSTLIAGRKRGGLTFAPEAGTQRLRDVINKNVSEEDLLSSTKAAMEAGWRRMKLYFMIGLPTETDEDLVGIAQMANAAYEAMKEAIPPDQRGSLRLGLSVNVFVPKSQTPFQWDGQIPSEEAARRVTVIRRNLRYKAITLSYHEPKTSFVEAVMSRGGREVAALVEEAWRRGARFDAWTELFDAEAWRGAADDLGIDIEAIAETTYDSSHVLPWAHISCGVDPGFLASEREAAYTCQTTPDCTFDACSSCGACPALHARNVLAANRGGR